MKIPKLILKIFFVGMQKNLARLEFFSILTNKFLEFQDFKSLSTLFLSSITEDRKCAFSPSIVNCNV